MQEYVFPQVPKEQFVKELNKLLKANGYTREGRRQHWTKQIETGFVLIFDVQGCWDCKGDYYVRAGISIVGACKWDCSDYGHFYCLLTVYSTEQVYNDALKYFDEWTDIMKVRNQVQVLKEWRDRNPAKYLRTLPAGAKYEKPPFPVPGLEVYIYDYVLSPNI